MSSETLPFSPSVIRDGRYFSRQFAIIGGAASGKTTLVEHLIAAFEPPMIHLSAGGLMRQLGCKSGMSIHDFAEFLLTNPGLGHDEYVDQRVRDHMAFNNRIVDCHLPIFSPHAFLIKLLCPWRVCAERRAAQKNRSVDEVFWELVQRDKADSHRYEFLYPGTSQWLETHYDITVDTEKHSELQTFELVMAAHRQWVETWKGSIITEQLMPKR